MVKLVNYTFVSASLFFILFAMSFHMVYGDSKKQSVAFDYYSRESILHKLKFLVAFNPLFSVPFNIISLIEIFEKISYFDPLLRKPGGDLSRYKVLASRIALLTILFLLTLASTNIAVIFELVGALFGPILGFILPVML
jgi:amino acid permease